MTKVLITAIYLSQALIQVASATTGDWYGSPNNPRRINTIHVYALDPRTVVVAKDSWNTPKAPVPYWEFWDCQWRQTAQQCVAIYSLLEDTTRR